MEDGTSSSTGGSDDRSPVSRMDTEWDADTWCYTIRIYFIQPGPSGSGRSESGDDDNVGDEYEPGEIRATSVPDDEGRRELDVVGSVQPVPVEDEEDEIEWL